MRQFAAFDLDGTVIRWQLYHAITDYLAQSGVLPEGSADKINRAKLAWQTRQHAEAFSSYEDTLINVYLSALKGMQVGNVEEATERVFEQYKDQVYIFTRDLIKELKDKGFALVAITGSPQGIADMIGTYYGFDYCVGAIHHTKNGRFTGEQTSPLLVGKGRVLQQLVKDKKLDWTDSVAVGDTESDIPMLELVERPIAFNPNRKLLEFARSRQWPIVIERKSIVYKLRHDGRNYLLA